MTFLKKWLNEEQDGKKQKEQDAIQKRIEIERQRDFYKSATSQILEILRNYGVESFVKFGRGYIQNIITGGELITFHHRFPIKIPVKDQYKDVGKYQDLDVALFINYPTGELNGNMHKIPSSEKERECIYSFNIHMRDYSWKDKIQFVREFNYRNFEFYDPTLEDNVKYVLRLGEIPIDDIIKYYNNLETPSGFKPTPVDYRGIDYNIVEFLSLSPLVEHFLVKSKNENS